MNATIPAGPGAAAILNLARQHRTDHLARLVRRHRVRPDVWLWTALTAASLAWAAHTGRDGGGVAMIAAIAMASMVSSIAGFAFSAICGAILFHIHDDPVRIVQIMMACSIANQAAMTWAARNSINWRALVVYLGGGIPGLAIGLWILLHVDRTIYTHGFGVFLFAYGIYMLSRKPVVISRDLPAANVLVGFLGGITGGAAGFPGAFVTIWCGMKGWDKDRQRAVYQPFILIMQIAALTAIAISRHAGPAAGSFGAPDVVFIPAALLGTTLGLVIYRRLTDRHFARVVNLLLIVSGLSYLA